MTLRCPIGVELPDNMPLTYGMLTKSQFDDEIEKGYADMVEGRCFLPTMWKRN